jgi:hypothetical protein
VGGVPLRLLGYNPSVWYEQGHSAFLVWSERIELLAAGHSFDEVVKQSRCNTFSPYHVRQR